ncbi:MAG: ABC transporter substrate-binding protein, partial [Methanosarcina sp.]|nr:ABC transporter substrate-binding protein [Methanosarcina sp.]
ATGCGNSESTAEDTIRIGVFEPLSGVDEEAAKQEVDGIELAHSLYPTVLGKKVELVYADNKSEIGSAKLAAQKLVNANVEVVLGSFGNTLSLVGGEYFLDAEIPAIGITCSNPLVTTGNPYYFRVCLVDSFQGVMAAKYVFNELGEQKIAVMKALNDDYQAALAQRFSDKLASLTNNKDAVACTVEYAKGTSNFRSQLEAIRQSQAKVVFLTGTLEQASLIVKQAREEEMDTLFIGTHLWDQESLLQQLGEAAEGLIFTTYSDIESANIDNTEEFLCAYRELYGEDEEPESAVALGFDAYLLALDSIKRQAEETNKSLRDVIQGTKEFQGVTGSITFDKQGDPIKPVVFITVKNGEFIYKYTVMPEWGK